MNTSQLISHYRYIGVSLLAAALVARGSMSESTAAMIAQLVAGVVLMLGSSALHSLRLLVDAKIPTLAPFIDNIDAAVGGTVTQQTTTISKTDVTPKDAGK